MALNSVRVTESVDQAIRRHGQETYPHECCGALIGYAEDPPLILVALPLPNNTEEGPRRRFLIRPDDYRQAEAAAKSAQLSLLGFYHSHPDHPARPSQYDLDHAWPTFAYVIMSVAGPSRPSADWSRRSTERAKVEAAPAGAKAGDMTVWFLKDDRSSFEEGTLHHGENSHSDAAPTVHR